MQPNQAPPPAPIPKNTGNSNQYDFIMGSGNTPKKGLGSSLANGSKTFKIVVFGTGLLVLLIVIIVFISILGSSGKGQTESLINLAQTQAELVRVAEIGVKKAVSTDAKNLALTTQYSMQTSQNDTVALLATKGHKLKAKDLALKTNAKTDSQLDEAANNNSFDETFTKLIRSDLLSYQKTLQTIYLSSKSASEKQVLTSDFSSVSLLLGNQPKKSS